MVKRDDVVSWLERGLITQNEARALLGIPKAPEKPPLGVRCEYCDSIVDAGTNCPNCGAVLPALDETGDPNPFLKFAKVAHDFGSVVSPPPLTQMRRG